MANREDASNGGGKALRVGRDALRCDDVRMSKRCKGTRNCDRPVALDCFGCKLPLCRWHAEFTECHQRRAHRSQAEPDARVVVRAPKPPAAWRPPAQPKVREPRVRAPRRRSPAKRDAVRAMVLQRKTNAEIHAALGASTTLVASVRKLCGITAPFRRGGPPLKITAAQVEEVRRRWLAGESSRALALEYGVNRKTIAKHLVGLPGWNVRHRHRIRTAPEIIAAVTSELATGVSLNRVSRSCGVSFGTVARVARRLGLRRSA
jgi:uncharacterized protein YerC